MKRFKLLKKTKMINNNKIIGSSSSRRVINISKIIMANKSLEMIVEIYIKKIK